MHLTRIISCLLISTLIPCTFGLPVHSSDIINSIKGIQKKLEGNVNGISNSNDSQLSEDAPVVDEDADQLMPDLSMRQNKMFGFYGYIPAFAPIPAYYPTLPPPDYFSDYSYYGYNDDDEDDLMSRANTKKRPNQFKNSPIYYIRLPPTPYMFVPGVGYISQPPTYQPMTPIMPPVVPAVPASPFYNVPINFMSNGKPTNIYQWQGNPAMQLPNQFGMPPQPSYNPAQQHQQTLPSPPAPQPQIQRPQKPYRPYPRPPQNNYLQDSKVTHLKGPYMFNGRPEDIYLLSNYQNLQSPYNAAYYPDPYSYNNYNPYNGYY